MADDRMRRAKSIPIREIFPAGGTGNVQRRMNRYTPALRAARTAAVCERSQRLPPFSLVTWSALNAKFAA